MTGKKRVRFMGPGSSHSPVSKCDGSSIPSDAADASGLGDPKTSEYAFFKKLKQDVTKMFHPYQQRKENKQSKDCRSTDHVEEMNSKKHGNFKPMAHAKKAAPPGPNSLLSLQSSTFISPGLCSNITGMTKEVNNCIDFKSSSATKHGRGDCLDFPLSSYCNAGVAAGTEHIGGEVFSMKRLKLQKWIARTLFSENHELLKGYDLVSALLHRLLPDRTEYQDSLYGQSTAKTKCQLLTLPHSTAPLEGNCGHSRKFDMTDTSQLLDDGVSVPCSSKCTDMSTCTQLDEDFVSRQCNDRMLIRYEKPEPQSKYFPNNYDSFWSTTFMEWAPGCFGSYGSSVACETSAIVPWYAAPECQFVKDGVFSCWHQKSEDSNLQSIQKSFRDPSPSDATRSYGNLFEKDTSIEDFDRDKALRFNTWSSSDYDVSHEKYSPCASISLEEMNESPQVKTYGTNGEPCSLLHSWGTEASKNPRSFLYPTALNLDVFRLPLTVYSNDFQHGLGKTAFYGSLCSSSLVSDLLVDKHSCIVEDGYPEDRNFIAEGSDFTTRSYKPRMEWTVRYP